MDAQNFVRQDFGDSLDPSLARTLHNCQSRLERMRALVLYEMNQSEITKVNIGMLERDISDIIKELDRLLRVPNIDKLNPSLTDVQSTVRVARKCLHVASGLCEKAHTPRYLDALYQKYDEFCDCLDDAIELLGN
jgi:PHP family Zn ribbon phosphoesterase